MVLSKQTSSKAMGEEGECLFQLEAHGPCEGIVLGGPIEREEDHGSGCWRILGDM